LAHHEGAFPSLILVLSYNSPPSRTWPRDRSSWCRYFPRRRPESRCRL
jgi:hypothetical protein